MSRARNNPRNWRKLSSYLLAVLAGVGLTWMTLRANPDLLLPPANAQSLTAETAIAPNPNDGNAIAFVPDRQDRNFVAAAVERVGPAVVRIDTERTVAARQFSSPFSDDPFFRRFFGEDFLGQAPRREYQQRGQGSGFIINSNGIVLTNAHVVRNADRVVVSLRDGREFEGEVRGIDEPTDLAVVKIEGSNLPVAALGNSEQVRVGDWAIAVGNPLGLDNTVTLGIVSTLNRPSSKVGIPDKRLDFIQTDAAINPGNSGGPLLDAMGEVIGINTAIRADGQGIGFAIPINTAKEIQERLARGEEIPHPYIGIRMVTLTPELAEQLAGDPNSPIVVAGVQGVLIVQVVPDSPAARAGLRRGDVVTAINGEAIASADELQKRVENSQIGQSLDMTVRRSDRNLQLAVRPAQLDPRAFR